MAIVPGQLYLLIVAKLNIDLPQGPAPCGFRRLPTHDIEDNGRFIAYPHQPGAENRVYTLHETAICAGKVIDIGDPEAILAPRWAERLEDDVTRQCVGGMQAYYPWTPRELYTRAFADSLLDGTLEEAFPEIHRILSDNTTGLSGHRVPALILQGTDDVVVSVASQKAFAEKLCRARSAVTLSIYENARHDTRQVGFEEALSWMKAISGGAPAPSNCGELP